MDIPLQLVIIGLTNGAVIALNAVAVTLIYAVARVLNLAHGDVFALITVLVTSLVTALGLQLAWPPLALAGGLLVTLAAAVGGGAALMGLVERVAFWPFRDAAGGGSRLAPLIATLGLSFILYQGALIWRYFLPSWIPGEHRSVPGVPELPRESIPEVLPPVELFAGGVRFTLKDALVIGLALAAAAGVGVFLSRTRAGRAIRAVSQNLELARLLGVDPDAVVFRAFLLGGGLAGLAAAVFALYYTHPFANAGAQSGLTAFAAAMLGGIGNPLGALGAGLLLGLAAAFSDYYLAARWTPVLMQALLIGLLWTRARGADSAGPAERETLTASTPRPAGRWAWALALAGLLYPLLDQGLGLQRLATATSLAIYALLALGLHLLLGWAGLLDLGFAVSFGLGGYVTALATNRYAGPLAAALPQPLDFTGVAALSLLAGGLFGALKGPLTRRLRSDDLAIVTLALGQMARQLLANLGEASQLAAIPPPSLFTFGLTAPAARYYLAAGCAALAAWAGGRLLRSRVGRAWRAVNDDEAAAASSGVDPAHYQTLAFALASALAALAGALFAASFTYIDAEAVDFRLAAMALAMVILGGAGGGPGVILAALVVGGYDLIVIPALGAFLAQFQAAGQRFGSAFDPRGLSYLNFGLALYLTVLARARRPRA
jgi:branched-chain amino acid transport system permease protein